MQPHTLHVLYMSIFRHVFIQMKAYAILPALILNCLFLDHLVLSCLILSNLVSSHFVLS